MLVVFDLFSVLFMIFSLFYLIFCFAFLIFHFPQHLISQGVLGHALIFLLLNGVEAAP